MPNASTIVAAEHNTMNYNPITDSAAMQEVFCYSIPEKMDKYEHRDLEERLMQVAPEFSYRLDRVPFFDNDPELEAVLIFATITGDEHIDLDDTERELKASKIASFLQGIIGDRKMYAWKTHVPIVMLTPRDD